MSPPQIDYAAMPEDQLAEILAKIRSSRETQALQARLPAQLAPFKSNIDVIEPTQTVSVSPTDGRYNCSCSVEERRISMSVAVVSSSHSHSQESEEPDAKPLKLIWREWWTRSKCGTGFADSQMYSLSLQYGRGMHPKAEAKAFTGWYDDPGISVSAHSHGCVKFVAEEVARDMGFREGELDALEVIEALLGHDGRELLESHAPEGITLRTIIEDELEEEVDN